MTTAKACTGPGCARDVIARGYCAGHYKQWQEGRKLTPIRGNARRTRRNERGEKECHRCHEWMVEGCFNPLRSSEDGLSPYCPRCTKDRELWSSHKIRLPQYEALSESQGGKCKLCGGLPSSGRALHVDHDHACCDGAKSCGNCVRGLLCDLCNMTLGSARDDASLLRRAAQYLDDYRNRPAS